MCGLIVHKSWSICADFRCSCACISVLRCSLRQLFVCSGVLSLCVGLCIFFSMLSHCVCMLTCMYCCTEGFTSDPGVFVGWYWSLDCRYPCVILERCPGV